VAPDVSLIAPTGVSVICDIDDTVKDSGVLDKRRLWESTFFKPFKSVPGMQALLLRLTDNDRAVHYVSSSPWHLYQPLRRWLADDTFPVSSLHLKHIRLKDSTIRDILSSPEKTKPPAILALLKRYPKRTFVLVGDSGEKDPEVYADIARQARDQVTRILIRRVPGDPTPSSRFDTVFAGIPRNRWQLFDDPSEVK
jgi:phosphatidate phosphatase APP1